MSGHQHSIRVFEEFGGNKHAKCVLCGEKFHYMSKEDYDRLFTVKDSQGAQVFPTNSLPHPSVDQND